MLKSPFSYFSNTLKVSKPFFSLISYFSYPTLTFIPHSLKKKELTPFLFLKSRSFPLTCLFLANLTRESSLHAKSPFSFSSLHLYFPNVSINSQPFLTLFASRNCILFPLFSFCFFLSLEF